VNDTVFVTALLLFYAMIPLLKTEKITFQLAFTVVCMYSHTVAQYSQTICLTDATSHKRIRKESKREECFIQCDGQLVRLFGQW